LRRFGLFLIHLQLKNKASLPALPCQNILLYLPYLGETSLQLEKELQNFFRKYLKELAHLSLIHKTHTIGDHFKYKDKQAHLK